MKIEVWIPSWLAHYNQFLYSVIVFSKTYKINLTIHQNKDIKINGILMFLDTKSVYLDYSDDVIFIDNPRLYDFYFKRSLKPEFFSENVFPLNFQVNISTDVYSLLKKIGIKFLFDKKSKIEIIRSLDFFSVFTNNSHWDMIYNTEDFAINDNKGNIVYMTRLWNPDRNSETEEKNRRIIMNNFRIKTCRILKKEFNNAIVGVYPDEFAKKNANDILLDVKKTKKGNYIKTLKNADICIADDGLKDTPGWKIGEYTMFSKAIISTPINIVVENFIESKNYIKIEKTGNFESIINIIDNLIKNKNYMNLKNANQQWSRSYLDPLNYFLRILSIVENDNSLHRK